MTNKYRRDGTPYPEGEVGLREWAKDFGNLEYKIVKQDTLNDGKWISTVWLGLDHNFEGGRPLIFETVVFPEKGDYSEIEMERYSTEKEAIEGHNKMVEKYQT